MSETIFICKVCYDTDGLFVQPQHEKTEDGGVRICPRCGAVVHVYLNMGELDLGLLPKVKDNDFEIFG